jgi:hypothetical protein
MVSNFFSGLLRYSNFNRSHAMVPCRETTSSQTNACPFTYNCLILKDLKVQAHQASL